MTRTPPEADIWLRALGRRELPEKILLQGQTYRRAATFKHDFFAATGLYEGAAGKLVLKVGRQAELFGLPLAWLGRWLARREAEIYQRLQDLEAIPAYRGRWHKAGLLHAYVPGHPLRRHEWVNERFFDQLQAQIEEIHRRGMAYVDLNKRENIIVGDDGRPYLIDFQISFYWRHANRPIPTPVRWLLRRLQQGDLYHLAKHIKKHRPDLLRPEHEQMWERGIQSVRFYRRLSVPFTRLRRQTLKRLGRWRSGPA